MAEHDHDHGHDHDHPHEHDHGHEHVEGGDAATAVADEPRGEQKVTVEDSGPARKVLTIEVPAERVQKKIEESYGKLRDEAVIPGFRRGRAPRRLIEKRFASSVRDEVKGQILSECYTQAVEDEKLDVIGEPDVKDVENIKLPEEGPLTFKVEVEISPDVTLPDFDGIKIDKPVLTVSDEDVNQEIERFRDQFGQVRSLPDAKAQAGDWLRGDVTIVAGENAEATGEPIVHQADAYVKLNGESLNYRGHIVGIVVEDLGKRLEGKGVGENVAISMTGPAGHEDERIKNQPITIHLRIDHVERLEPASLETVIQQAGVESEDDLRKRIREMLENRNTQRQTSQMHEQLSNQLLERVQFELPEGLTGRQAERVLRRRAMEMAYQGVPQPEIEQRVAELRQSSEEEARRQLKQFFILDKAAKQLDVEVSESEVNGRIAALAMQQGRRMEKMRQELARRGDLQYLYLQIREQKTMDKLLEKATVTEVPAPAEKPAA